jgi:hypothetical protein
MAQDPRLTVTLCNTGHISQASPTRAFAETIGVPLHFISFRDNPPQPRTRWPFFLELDALAQPQVDEAVLDAVGKIGPDVVAIDYLFSALYAPSLFPAPVRKVLITLNRESEFYRAQRTLRRLPPDHSESRLSAFERSI